MKKSLSFSIFFYSSNVSAHHTQAKPNNKVQFPTDYCIYKGRKKRKALSLCEKVADHGFDCGSEDSQTPGNAFVGCGLVRSFFTEGQVSVISSLHLPGKCRK